MVSLICSNTGRRFCEVAARAYYMFRQDYVVFSWFPGSWQNGGILLAGILSFQDLLYRISEYSVSSRMNIKQGLDLLDPSVRPWYSLRFRLFSEICYSCLVATKSRLLSCWLPDCMQEDRVHAPRYPTSTSVSCMLFLARST